MLDIELKKWYDAVKDPSWPEIKNYIDFYKLPAQIKEECHIMHGFRQRRDQIEDCDYWQKITCNVYQHQNLVFVPITKCACTYYIHLFDTMGWKKKNISDIDVNSVVMFGLVKHPFTRWVKGIVELLTMSYYTMPVGWDNDSNLPSNVTDAQTYYRASVGDAYQINWQQFSIDIQKDSIKKFLNNVVIGDNHTMPYSAMFGSLINRINWIPMDLLNNDNDIKISIMNLFKKYNHNIDLPLNVPRAWASSADKLKIENIVKDALESSETATTGRLLNLYKIYATDLKFYHNLIDNFDPQWSLINNIQA